MNHGRFASNRQTSAEHRINNLEPFTEECFRRDGIVRLDCPCGQPRLGKPGSLPPTCRKCREERIAA